MAIAIPLLLIARRAVMILRQRASLNKTAAADIDLPKGTHYVWDNDAFRRNIIPELATMGAITVLLFTGLLPFIAASDIVVNPKVQGEMMVCFCLLSCFTNI